MILAVALFIVAVGYFTGPAGRNGQKTPLEELINKTKVKTYIVRVGNLEIKVEVADTNEKRSLGLSNRETLDAAEGMFFVFSGKSQNSFWMKDMRLPIDIIWIDEGKIVGIDQNVQPQPGVADAQLKLYYPPVPVSEVLEVNAGFSDANGLNVGDSVELAFTPPALP